MAEFGMTRVRIGLFQHAAATNEASSGGTVMPGNTYIESLFLQVANARRKAEAQQTAHGKDMIGEAAGVGVVLGSVCWTPRQFGLNYRSVCFLPEPLPPLRTVRTMLVP
jgi:hypothetical protein